MKGGGTRAGWIIALGVLVGCGDDSAVPADAALPPDAADAALPADATDAAVPVDAIDAPTPLATPTGVMASDGLFTDHVHVSWNVVPGATAYRVWRDGMQIAEVTATEYDDVFADPVVPPTAPVLSATTGTYSDRVELTWIPSAVPPLNANYVVSAVRGAEESARSVADPGYQAVPVHYEVSKDGGQSFPIVTPQTSYADMTAPESVLVPGVVDASDGTSYVEVSVSVTGTTNAPTLVSYAVRAVTSTASTRSNTVVGYRGIGSPSFAWTRYSFDVGQQPTVPLPATASFVDATTAGGEAYAYECMLSAAGAAPATTKPDVGWRKATASETPRRDTWITNREVDAVAVANDAIYVGGSFDYIGPPTGAFAALDATTGAPSMSFARVSEGAVYAVTRDAAGRWYIGGGFVAVSGVPQRRIARLTPSGEIDPTFHPVIFEGDVWSIAVSADTVFVTGSFHSVDWQPRNGFAALDIATGRLRSYAPIVSHTSGSQSYISSVHVVGTSLFIEGEFDSVDSAARSDVAAIDLASKVVTGWDAHANGSMHIAGIRGSDIFVIGEFTQIGGQARNGLAVLDAVSGNATAFDPAPDGLFAVRRVAVMGSTVYAAGTFTVIGGQPRAGLAALDATTGVARAFQVDPTAPLALGSVSALAVTGNALYVGLDDWSGGFPRPQLAAFDATTGALLPWTSSAPEQTSLYDLQAFGTTVFVAGDFSSIGGQERRNLAALDRITGALLPWRADADSQVLTLAVDGTTLCAGGSFRQLAGQPRMAVGCLDRETAVPLAWSADADGSVNDLVIRNGLLYVGGEHTRIGGQSRPYVASLDISTGAITAWNPALDGRVARIEVAGGNVYLAGSSYRGFESVGGQPRKWLAAVNATTGAVSPWNPDPDFPVYDVHAAGGMLYVAGLFTSIGGVPRPVLASFTLPSGLLSSWAPPVMNGFGDAIGAIAVSETVFAVGWFRFAGRGPEGAGAFAAADGSVVAWYPWISTGAARLTFDGTALVAVGYRGTVAGYPRGGIAIFDP